MKEHIDLLIKSLKSTRVIWKPIVLVCPGRVPEEDALHLTGKVHRQLRIVPHHVAVTRVGHQDEFSVRVGGENLPQQKITDAQSCADIAKIKRSRVKRATGVRLVDEFHIISCHLFGGCRQVVEMDVRYAARPVGVNVGHVHPWGERTRERVQQAFLRLVDLGHPQNIINVRNDRDPRRWHEIGGGIPNITSLGVDIQSLNTLRGIPWRQSVVFDLHKCVEIALLSGGIWKLNLLTATGRGDGSSSTWFPGRSCRWRRPQVKSDINIVLLEHEDTGGEVPGLGRLIGRQFFDGRVDKENVGKVIEFGLLDLWLFIHVAMKA